MFFLNKKKSAKDNRHFERFEYWFNVQVFIENRPGEVHEAYCKNVSEGGMLFIALEGFPVSSICYISFDLPEMEERMEIKGVVLRSETHSERNFHETAVTFVGTDEKKAKKLKKIQDIYSKN